MRRLAANVAIGGTPPRRPRGFSLVELMIAMTLGLLLTSAILALFVSSARVEATESTLARMQENGRVAIGALAADLQQAGRLPCGARVRPQVFADPLSAHIEARPATANAPAETPADKPYLLDRGIFIAGHTCNASSCSPAPSPALGVPKAGHAIGDRIPATDILVLRYLQGNGWPSTPIGTAPGCAHDESLTAIAASGMPPEGFNPAHLALLASCTQAQIFAVDATLRPLSGRFGVPKCAGSPSQPLQLFDLDTQLQTTVYYLQVTQDAASPSRKIATLMRRTNGVVNEIVQGVERFDLRYLVHDLDGNAHWLTADNIERGVSQSGASLLCAADTEARACSWSDVEAVEVDLLVNTVDELPISVTDASRHYRYSPDGDAMQAPGASMPGTGLPVGRMLRREFRTVVALRSFVT